MNVNVIYSTDTQRTRDTVNLLSKARGIEIQTYGKTSPDWFSDIESANPGEVVSIVGHSTDMLVHRAGVFRND